MPELPDVEIFRQYLDATSLRQPIDKIVSPDTIRLWETSPRKFQPVLEGNQLHKTMRDGKYVFAGLNGNNCLGFHFGMSGSLKYFKHKVQRPSRMRMLVRLRNGSYLAYVSVRRLGKLFIAKDVKTFVERRRLGPDALATDFHTFQSIFQNRSGSTKTPLMNQQAISGLGNMYTDEILFQAGIRPTRKCTPVDSKEWQPIYPTMKTVLNAVIKKRAQPERFPRSYPTLHRSPGEKCPKCGTRLKNKKVGGRTTYYCPGHQN